MPTSNAEAAAFGLQAGLGVTAGDVNAIRSMGYESWLNAEMAQPLGETGVSFLLDQGYDAITTDQFFFRRALVDYALYKQLMSGENNVRRKVALALSQMFVVSVNGVNMQWRGIGVTDYWDMLVRNAFGNFRDLLEDVTLHPAMAEYLTMLGSRRADERSGRRPDENYAREIMQLFTIGLYELNLDGTLRLGGNGQPIETYDNDDVTGLSEVFTGYQHDYTDVGENPHPSGDSYSVFTPQVMLQRVTSDSSKWRFPRTDNFHADTETSFLGTTVPAGTDAPNSLRIALDTLFAHPNVGPFFAKQMIQRLVTSNPSPAYVERVASVFNDNGQGERGDMGATFKAILLDQEALNPNRLADPSFGKVREPMLRLVQWGRTFKADSPSGQWLVADLSDSATRLGQSPMRSPSVFNFYRPGYVPPNTAIATNDLVAPEFAIVNESSIAGYVNFMERVIEGRGWQLNDVRADYTSELNLVDDIDALLERIDVLLTGGQLRASTLSTISSALSATSLDETISEEDRLRRVHTAILLVMASPDYLVQK
ncbi:MAG: DUF1800 domain-containing protein [Pseudomonadota bacterium]